MTTEELQSALSQREEQLRAALEKNERLEAALSRYECATQPEIDPATQISRLYPGSQRPVNLGGGQ